jgi:hypothetical protein
MKTKIFILLVCSLALCHSLEISMDTELLNGSMDEVINMQCDNCKISLYGTFSPTAQFFVNGSRMVVSFNGIISSPNSSIFIVPSSTRTNIVLNSSKIGTIHLNGSTSYIGLYSYNSTIGRWFVPNAGTTCSYCSVYFNYTNYTTYAQGMFVNTTFFNSTLIFQRSIAVFRLMTALYTTIGVYFPMNYTSAGYARTVTFDNVTFNDTKLFFQQVTYIDSYTPRIEKYFNRVNIYDLSASISMAYGHDGGQYVYFDFGWFVKPFCPYSLYSPGYHRFAIDSASCTNAPMTAIAINYPYPSPIFPSTALEFQPWPPTPNPPTPEPPTPEPPTPYPLTPNPPTLEPPTPEPPTPYPLTPNPPTSEPPTPTPPTPEPPTPSPPIPTSPPTTTTNTPYPQPTPVPITSAPLTTMPSTPTPTNITQANDSDSQVSPVEPIIPDANITDLVYSDSGPEYVTAGVLTAMSSGSGVGSRSKMFTLRVTSACRGNNATYELSHFDYPINFPKLTPETFTYFSNFLRTAHMYAAVYLLSIVIVAIAIWQRNELLLELSLIFEANSYGFIYPNFVRDFVATFLYSDVMSERVIAGTYLLFFIGTSLFKIVMVVLYGQPISCSTTAPTAPTEVSILAVPLPVSTEVDPFAEPLLISTACDESNSTTTSEPVDKANEQPENSAAKFTKLHLLMAEYYNFCKDPKILRYRVLFVFDCTMNTVLGVMAGSADPREDTECLPIRVVSLLFLFAYVAFVAIVRPINSTFEFISSMVKTVFATVAVGMSIDPNADMAKFVDYMMFAIVFLSFCDLVRSVIIFGHEKYTKYIKDQVIKSMDIKTNSSFP